MPGKNNHKKESSQPKRALMKTVSSKPNLRNQQRVEASLDVLLSRPDGTAITCRCTNLSRAGMTITCDNSIAKDLLPGQKPNAPGEWLEVAARFSLPLAGKASADIYSEGVVVYLRRVNRETFQIGIQFSRFEGECHDYVDQFVSQQLSGSV
jgi:hypothetical protein